VVKRLGSKYESPNDISAIITNSENSKDFRVTWQIKKDIAAVVEVHKYISSH